MSSGTDLLQRITKASADLSKSERKVAEAILALPQQAARENIAQLAARAQVSEPTVFRFCKRFGAEGFPDFKLALSMALAAENTTPPSTLSRGDTVEDVAHKVIGNAVNALQGLQRQVDAPLLARCIDLISQARRLVVGAQGSSRLLAEFLRGRLIDIGLQCECYSDPAQLLPVAVSLRQGELLVAISSDGESRDMLEAAQLAADSGATVLALCPPKTALSDLSGLTLGPAGQDSAESGALSSETLEMTVLLEILLSGISLRRADSIKALSPRLRQARARLSLNRNAVSNEPVTPEPSLKANEPITAINWPY
ncbi:MAG: MurR/RpiR family transcriptional regulator [Succinivibrio sp.]|nr:MurR/RpiR family transcriptional regulator [Succinivibrio sp.]